MELANLNFHAVPIPPAVLYAGLGGTVLALLVATWQQNWKCRVFFLLALRLAIGWHFLFEGLHKVHSHYAGPTDQGRPFSSEPYFKVAPGPLGAYMRKQFDDPEAAIAAKATAGKKIAPDEFAKLSADEQAANCPDAVAKALDAALADTEKRIKDESTAAITRATNKAAEDLKTAATDDEKAKVRAAAEAATKAAQKAADGAAEAAKAEVLAAKAEYARWVYGVDGRDCKVKNITGDVRLTAPQRIHHVESLRHELKEADARRSTGLGTGFDYASKKEAEVRADFIAAETDLAKDANAFVAELKERLTGTKAVAEKTETRLGDRMDKVTMWFLVAVGSCLLAGFLTPVACVGAAGFLLLTYLNHPAFPWYPAPPGTEGNPVFVNKNVIECLALLALATIPTGRWMGLDALFVRRKAS